MPDDSYRTIRTLLASTQYADLRKGLELAELEIVKVGSSEAKPLFEMVSPLFYIDALDHPELVPILDEAVNLAARLGPPIIPILIENLNAGDLKAQWAIAHVLGRIGADAIKPMVKAYVSATDPTMRAFILYALGKIKSPKIVQAAALALEAADSSNLELRDTATRALGKLLESIPPESLPEETRKLFLERLYMNLSDQNQGVRAKAMRGLGKMAKYKHLTVSERAHLKAVCQNILGTDDSGEWDRAFRIRKEAGEALQAL
ncbi:MAG TPA: HEAT repeat domain-containing protein [Acidobacteriota bacterium]|nr:HEAT repeat domain-containing protein [Acidobacteriota bacterium]